MCLFTNRIVKFTNKLVKLVFTKQISKVTGLSSIFIDNDVAFCSELHIDVMNNLEI